MTRKDFELIARIFSKNINNTTRVSVKLYSVKTINIAMAKQFADVLQTANPNFNKATFLKACGVED